MNNYGKRTNISRSFQNMAAESENDFIPTGPCRFSD